MIERLRKVSKEDMIAWFEEHDALINSLLAFADMKQVERKREKAKALLDSSYELRSQAIGYMDRAANVDSINERLKLSNKAAKLLRQANQIEEQESKLWS